MGKLLNRVRYGVPVAAGSLLATNAFAFDATSLDGVSAVVTALIAVGVTITLAMVTYKIGRRVTNRV